MKAPFNLKLTIGSDGTFTIVNAKALSAADGLSADGAGLVLAPLGNGEPNRARLQTLLLKEKRQRLGGDPPDIYPDADQITVVAPVSMRYQEVVSTLDYLRFEPIPPGKEASDVDQMFTVITLSPGSVGG